MSIRVDPRGDHLNLVLPRRTSLAEGFAFAEREKGWVAKCLDDLRPPLPFGEGAVVPYLGEPHVIQHLPDARRGVWLEEGKICVSGNDEHLPRRVTDFLKRLARQAITSAVRKKAATLARPVGRITLRDPRSCWGSCSVDGDLSFSWRLILAPDYVLDYVVAHEVAHLAEYNHGPRFWALAASISNRMEEAKVWLKRNGRDLWRYG